jgi:hypothetical protein
MKITLSLAPMCIIAFSDPYTAAPEPWLFKLIKYIIAMAIFNEMQPEELLLDEKQMRPHLEACLLDGQSEVFSL